MTSPMRQLLAELRHVPGRWSWIVRLGEVFNQPELRVSTDRSRAQQLGISQHDVANNLLLTLSGSVLTRSRRRSG